MVNPSLTEVTEELVKEGRTAKVQLMVEPSLLRQVDDWRFAKRIPSRSQAMRRLMERGLESQNEKGPAEVAASPSLGSSNSSGGNAYEQA